MERGEEGKREKGVGRREEKEGGRGGRRRREKKEGIFLSHADTVSRSPE